MRRICGDLPRLPKAHLSHLSHILLKKQRMTVLVRQEGELLADLRTVAICR